jgi:N-succinyldiaminopimelate aminotransferase
MNLQKMNPRLAGLRLYPFQKLAKLMRDITPPAHKSAISYALGEPKHAAPAFVLEEIKTHLPTLSTYPTTRGVAALRAAIAAWATQRFGLHRVTLDPERHVLPACGTREALFSIVQAVIDPQKTRQPPVVILPNPFYQIYEGAALLAGAEVYYLNTLAESNYKMDFSQVPEKVWQRTQMVFVCSPGNPTGAVMKVPELQELIRLARQYDFIIAADECYSEIYFDEDAPPPGLLQVADSLGIEDYRHCLVFHSLSKRSNLPGLRSGFIAGDGAVMADYLRYRTYQGCSLHALAQAASIKAWSDEAHVRDNRAQYRAKFAAVLEILSPVMQVRKPDASFYLWPQTPIDDEEFARGLLAQENVLVLPGRYLSREAEGVDPGYHRVRMALVAPYEECVQAAQRIRDYVLSL